MARRSLLGGARRHQRAAVQEVEEHAWLEQIRGDQSSSDACGESSQRSPADNGGEQGLGNIPDRSGSQPRAEAEPDLRWKPSGSADAGTRRVDKADSQAEVLQELPWTFDEEISLSPEAKPHGDDRQRVGIVASNEFFSGPQTANQGSDLTDITSRDLRNRQIILVGWTLLLIVVLLTLLVGLL